MAWFRPQSHSTPPFGQGGPLVRIGIDMLGLQSPESRGRGIGRDSRNLVSALLAADADNEYFFYTHDGLPADDFPSAANVQVRPLAKNDNRGDAIDRLVRRNPDRV